jgi:S1-C subfamily serine protease
MRQAERYRVALLGAVAGLLLAGCSADRAGPVASATAEPGGAIRERLGPVPGEVDRNAAGAAGIRRGQLLLSINGREVESPVDVARIAEELHGGDVVSVRVRTPRFRELIVNYRLHP